MADIKVSVDEMDQAISEQLQKYAGSITEDMKDSLRDSAKEIRRDISRNAPFRTGRYKKSWSVKIEEWSAGLYTIATVHSRDRYQIAHLLEKGHAKRGGGRVPGRAHIKPAEEAAVEKVQEGVEEIAQKGD